MCANYTLIKVFFRKRSITFGHFCRGCARNSRGVGGVSGKTATRPSRAGRQKKPPPTNQRGQVGRGKGPPNRHSTPWHPRPLFWSNHQSDTQSFPTAFCPAHRAPQKNGFSALRLCVKLQLRKCLNNPRHGNARTESTSSAPIMQNVSLPSIPEHTSSPSSILPPNIPHSALSDRVPKSSDKGTQ